MKTTAIQTVDRTHQLIKTTILMMVTILLLTGGAAYASHRHDDYNSGLSISFDYISYPQRHQYYDVYREPIYYTQFNDHHYRGHRGHHKQWKNKHSNKHHGKHHRKHHRKHNRRQHHH